MLRRPLLSALKAGSGSSSRVIAAVPASYRQSRFASTTAPETPRKVIFDQTSNPELDAVLTEMLHKIILPARLPKKKRKMISNAKFAQRLQVDPIIIEVEGYEHRFPVLDYHQKTIPKSRDLLRSAVRLMATRDDWSNLVRVLSGYRNAGRIVRTADVMDIIAKAGASGNVYAVVDALRAVKESDLRIRTVPRADAVLHHVQMMALDADYAEKEARSARTWSLMLRDLMEDDDHAKYPTWPGRVPLHREPHIVGQVLHTVAAHAVHHGAGADADGKVAELATVLAHVWPAGKGLAEIHKVNIAADAKPSERIEFMRENDAHLALATSRRISVSSFVLHGIGMAQKVVEPGLAAELEPIAEVLRRDLAELVAKRGEVKANLGWAVYDKLIAKA